MEHMIRAGVSEEEKKLGYYKYYIKGLVPVPEEKLLILDAGASIVPGVSFEQRQLFLQGKDYMYCQTGYGIGENGTGFVCNTTYMPGVSGEMLDWWFPWHSVGPDLRYKIWDPEDHYFAKADNVGYVCDPQVPMHQKTWGVNHYILEDVGEGPQFLKLCFKSPKDFGYDLSTADKTKCQSLVCAVGEGSCAAAMTHKWYPYEKGVMFCSRFWIGYGIVGDKIMKILPEGMAVPEEVTKGLFAHNIKEFSNLAEILPKLYEENRSL